MVKKKIQKTQTVQSQKMTSKAFGENLTRSKISCKMLKFELIKKKHEQKNDETESTDETSKYKDTRITDFFSKIKKSEVSLVEGL